ncbi:Peroxisomal 2,4-dienoyl-CoA reductase [Geodia barretti]|uniref:Peroxisomal 2,4-dienoyl-CoA reductase n=1 Tax=Geodia barretti TaxID=519541 RepID=A0AA35SSY5_GEOBA|nr:Peroxisomal 2,4-dienoyl-CoA reductase [Geodia barretti]
MDFGLTDKKAFVVGASKGIGKAIALELAREGCDVAIASRTVTDLEQAAQEIAEATGRNIIAIAMDATSREQVDAAVAEAAQRAGRAAHPGEQRVASRRLGGCHRTHRYR